MNNCMSLLQLNAPELLQLFVCQEHCALRQQRKSITCIIKQTQDVRLSLLQLEGPELESRFLEPFVPEDHYALRQREFDTLIVAPASPLNSALLRSESLEEDGLVMSPANPMDEAAGALPRSVSVASVPGLESGVPSVEALLKQVRFLLVDLS
jgi:hypothetical protein